MRRSHDSVHGIQQSCYSEYHMREKQVGERQQNNHNAIMFGAHFRSEQAVV